MANGKGIVAASFTPDKFDDYCHRLQWPAWRPSLLVVHNIARSTDSTGGHLGHIEDLAGRVEEANGKPPI